MITMKLEQVRDKLRKTAKFERDVGMPSNARAWDEMANAIDAHIARPAQAVDVEVVRKCRSEVIHALAAIVNCPQTDAQCAAEVIPRDPVMSEVMRVRQAMDKLTRAISAKKARPVDGWQPIETAPMDGTRILAYDGKDISTVSWYVAGPKSAWWDLVVTGYGAEDGDWSPTHWMPLPKPQKS